MSFKFLGAFLSGMSGTQKFILAAIAGSFFLLGLPAAAVVATIYIQTEAETADANSQKEDSQVTSEELSEFMQETSKVLTEALKGDEDSPISLAKNIEQIDKNLQSALLEMQEQSRSINSIQLSVAALTSHNTTQDREIGRIEGRLDRQDIDIDALKALSSELKAEMRVILRDMNIGMVPFDIDGTE